MLTAWNPAEALRGAGKFDWVAVQLDNETGASAVTIATLRNVGFRVFGWEARASEQGVNRAKSWGLDGYIGQAESDVEARACLALIPEMPKAVIGNATSWSASSFKALADRGWDFILEWYWNAIPSYSAPNAANYPYFVSVCFGCYDASGEQPDGRRVALADYRQIWRGSWCVYLAETMTDLDWAAA